ncbi:hypothetical protein ACQEV2_38585 [Streptomyces sp. CA-251387]|uniref:hypothetical protein n=1 Tax=Streptomyces sp. CA-251387 TaxID=3240064 RepID=UPI003D92A116
MMSIKCVRLDNDCADLCTVAARILARQTGYDAPTTMAIIEATRTVLRASADAAEEFKGTPYFELSAKECRETEQLLGRLAEQMGSSDAGEGYPTSPPSATTPAGGGAGRLERQRRPRRSPRLGPGLMPYYNPILYVSGTAAVAALLLENDSAPRRLPLLTPPLVPLLVAAQHAEHRRLKAIAAARPGWWNRRLAEPDGSPDTTADQRRAAITPG